MAWVGKALMSLPSRKVIMECYKVTTFNSLSRQIPLLGFENERKIDAFTLDDVEAVR